MERSAWRDERLDDFAAATERNFALVRADIADLREEMREGFRELRAEMLALHRQLAQIGWGLAIAMIGAIVALVVAVA